MFIGNILLGRLKPAKEIKLIQKRELEKLLIYIDSYRLSLEAEAELIADPQGLEPVLEKYLHRYGIFQADNNIRFVQSIHKFKNLLMVFASGFDTNRLSTDDCYAVLEALLMQKLKYAEAQAAFKYIFDKVLDVKMRQDFEANIVAERKNVALCKLIAWYPERSKIIDKELFALFLQSVTVEEQKGYLSIQDIPESFQQYLLDQKNWPLVNHYILKHHKFAVSSAVDFANFIEYNQSNCQIVEDFLMHNPVSTQIRQYLLDQKCWSWVDCCLEAGNNFVFSSLQQFFDFVQIFPLSFKIAAQALGNLEIELFDPQHEKSLLKFVYSCRFQNHDNEFRFLMLYKQYPQEVKRYLEKYQYQIQLTEEEQLQFIEEKQDVLVYLKKVSPMVFKDFVLPEYRRKPRQLNNDEISHLIDLSLDNPLLLSNYIQEYDGLPEELETKLFFSTTPEICQDYLKRYGINILRLLQEAKDFVEPKEYEWFSKQRTSLSKTCPHLGRKRYIPNHFELVASDFKDCNTPFVQKSICQYGSYYGCKDCSECPTLIDRQGELLDNVFRMLYAIARRHYLAA